MKKNLLTATLCALAFGLGFGINNIAFSNIDPAKVAYIDVDKLIVASKTLKSAQETQAKQTKEMLDWFEKASADIQKQQTKAGKDELIKKYEAQLTQKKKTISETYQKPPKIELMISGGFSILIMKGGVAWKKRN